MEPEPAAHAPGSSKTAPIAIVGIGASAGGLSALKQLFGHVPKDSGLAFVVVVHLSPEHESHLANLLQPHVKLPVQQVEGTVAIERDHVYVIPPNANLDNIDTHLRLSALETRREDRAPIDHFFRSLGDAHGHNAVAVVLTGTGSDGTLGLRHVHGRGGLTIVQDPSEAEYTGMPRSAIAAGHADLVLPLAHIPSAAIRFSRTRPDLAIPEDSEQGDAVGQALLQKVLAQVRARTGRDFRHYKHSTLLRRVARRMQFHQITDRQAYVELLRTQPEEGEALANEFLVTVTSFFRDAEVFDLVRQQLLPELFQGKGADDTIRVWSAGCATGEEAYTLAMLLLEEAGRHETPPSIQVFASDLHTASLDTAREGVYAGDIESSVSRARLNRYFHKERGGYRVRKELRELVVFSCHNLLSDPPFSRVDLISCRNLLIYLQRDCQAKVAELFHYALRPDGVLLLGASESLDAPELLRIENKKHCVYRKRNVRPAEPQLPVFPLVRGRMLPDGSAADHGSGDQVAYDELHRQLLDRLGPPSVLVGPDDSIVHFSARAGRYLVHPGGSPTTNVFKLVREELHLELRAALALVRGAEEAVRTRPVSVRFDSERAPVVLDLRRASGPTYRGFALLTFDEREAPKPVSATPKAEARTKALRDAEQSRQRTEHQLQAIIEEYETSREEIRASNEELQSTNEELRSTLEELETSKEELQSMNEELQTLNQENRHKVDELDQLSGDLQNLLVATDIATLFLDRELRIMRFTPRVGELFNVQPADRGRAIGDFTSRIGYEGLQADCAQVLERLVPVSREVLAHSGAWFLARVLPYRSGDDRIDGVVVTFVEISLQKRAEAEIQLAKEIYAHILDALPEPLLILTTDLRIRSANAAFYDYFKLTPQETEGTHIYEVGRGEWDLPALRTLLDNVLPDCAVFRSYQVDHVFPALGRRVMLLGGRWLDDRQLILLAIQDITERSEAEEALRTSEALVAAELTAMQRLHGLVSRLLVCRDLESALDTVLSAAIEISGAVKGNVQLLDPGGDHLALIAHQGFDAASCERFARGELDDNTACSRALRSGERVIIEDVRLDPDYAEYRAAAEAAGYRSVQSTPLKSRRGEVLGILSTHYTHPHRPSDRDLRVLDLYARQATEFIERMRADEALRQSENRLGEENRHKDEYIAMLGHELRNPLAAIQGAVELIAQRDSADPVLQRAGKVLERQSEQMARMVDGLLDIARIARGKVSLDLAPLDVRVLLEGLLSDNAARASERKIDLRSQLATRPLMVLADSSRLVQVFDNLLGNALKFTESPGSVDISAQRSGDLAEIRVRDTGVGIAKEMLTRIFASFEQGSEDIARKKGGLGLGLALAKGLVELHGGTIAAQSEGPGTGAELIVRLPLTPDRVGEGGGAQSDSEQLARDILVVEDNEDAAQMLADLLQMRGHAVVVVPNAQSALEALHDKRADVVLCDIGLPGMNGYEFAQTVRADAVLRDTLLVAVTGYGQRDDRERSAAAGFDAHLVKPIDLRALERTLGRLRH